ARLRDTAGATGARPGLRRLVEIADDAALRADQATTGAPAAPSTSPGSSGAAGRHALALRWPAADAGALAGAARAGPPGARFLVALGELGVRILGRDERTLAHIDQPAARLAVSDLGTRAIAVAPRGQLQRLARLDLAERRGAHWCDVELDSFVSSFDGE